MMQYGHIIEVSYSMVSHDASFGKVEYRTDLECTIGTTYLNLKGELIGAYCEYIGEVYAC